MGDNAMSRGEIRFISAGAGSGKTTRLTSILAEKLLGKKVKPEGIIATTFTNKAATELKERVRATLLEKNRQDLAVSIFEAQIGTVNSVCGALLRRFAFELGLTIEQKVLDEHSAMAHLSRALDSAVSADNLASVTALAHRLGSVEYRTGELLWKKHVKDVIDLARYNNVGPVSFNTFARKNADELLDRFPEPAGDDLEEKVLSAIAGLKPEFEKELANKPQKNTRDYFELLTRFEGALHTGSFVWKDWLDIVKKKPGKALLEKKERLDTLCKAVLTHPGLHKDIHDYLILVFALAEKTLGIYQDQKRKLGFIDFADQEAMLLKALETPEVREQLREKLDLLLVDEFQDTSPLQLALFLKLSVLARQTYWVGDVKQAIYSFRGGDARLMKAVLDFLPDAGKDILGRSWRSVPSLVGAFNSVFRETFSAAMKPEDIVLGPEREEHPSQVSFFRWGLGKGAQLQQYKAVGEGIERLLEEKFEVFDKEEKAWRTVQYGDIAILARTNAHVQKIAAVLKQSGIPAATEQPGLFASPESLLVTAGLRRLVDPSDTLATAEIYSLVTCSEPEEWIRSRREYLQTDQDPARWLEDGDGAHPVLREIARLRERAAELTPSGAILALITKTDVPRHVLAWCRESEQARIRLLNIQKHVELAGEYEAECLTNGVSATLRGLVHWFGERADSQEDLFPEPPVNAVRVLTFHKSKGLEWPVVILLDLEKPGNFDLSAPTAESIHGIDAAVPLKDRFIRFWPLPFSGSEPLNGLETVMQSRIVREAETMRREESARLLYVAMTRVRDCLVLATSSKSRSFPWLEETGADCFLGKGGKGVRLPDGSLLPCERWDGLEEVRNAVKPGKERAVLHWYDPHERSAERLPEQISPSLREASSDASVVETIMYGNMLDLRGESAPAEKGTAVHDILAFALTQEPGVCDAASVAVLLERYGMAGLCGSEAFEGQLGCFRQMLSERWPDGKLDIEVPVEQVLPRDQVLKGQIDLLLETPNGWVVIDHKITAIEPDAWDAKAMEYSGQLYDYKQALEAITGRPVESCWINLFAAGGLLRLDV